MDILGQGSFRYEVNTNWAKLDPIRFPVNDCHEMAMDKLGRIFMLTNDTANNILIFDQQGNLLDSWGHEYPGGHGLSIFEENGVEYLLITDTERHEVIKTTLSGELVMAIGAPRHIPDYSSCDQFQPTETAVAANGDIYITDGYGLQFVIQLDSTGNYIRHWGGKGNLPHQFDCVHGIAIDNRSSTPMLLITSRNHNCIKRFTLDGRYISQIELPGSFVCRPVLKDGLLYAAVFRSGSNTNFGSGYVVILDKEDKLAAVLERQVDKVFIHPHDVCITDEGHILVCQWKANKTYPILLEKC